MRDLALLLGYLVKFRRFVVLQTALENLEDFRRGFACGTHDKDALEPLFVSAITFGQSNLDVFASGSNLLLFFARPGR